jgi:prepilin-type N-terminal cleavage/methylation domain-containing protein
MKKIKAFTLIELLTVVAIIAILTSVTILGLQEVRKKAQDTTRLANIKEIQIALETYKSSRGRYPDAGTQGSSEYIIGLAPIYISKLPIDPTGVHNGTAGYIYSVSTDRKEYCFSIENTVAKAANQKDLYNIDQGENTWSVCVAGN